LAGTWEGDQGLDEAFSNAEGKVIETPYREKMILNPFGPVDNGSQVLYGLDYRTSAWRGDEENPFHTEVGYWLWDAAERQVMRCFMVPRGYTVLAGGTAGPDDTTFTMAATAGSETYGILSNRYLSEKARSISYEVTVTVTGDDSFGYDETTTIQHARHADLVIHTDRNSLHRVG
jgi:hypothetical protein